MTHLVYSLVELSVIFDAIQDKIVTTITSHSTGSPITEVIDLLDGVKTIHHLFFFEDILIIQILKGQHCKVIVQIFFTPKGMLILEYSKEL